MNPTHLIITNRAPAAPADGWIHIVPKGELPNREAGLIQVLDDTALDSILKNLEADRARLGDKWPGLYLGEEHFIYDDTRSSAALGWAKEFEKRADGIWARPELTDLGRAAIENRRFKYTSFVADRKDTQDLGGGRVRILRIDTVGFTNHANGRELLTPVVNRGAYHAPIPFADAGASAANKPTPTKGTMKNIAETLGLAAEASEDAILAEVTKLQNRCRDLEPAAEEVKLLKNRLAVLDAEQVDALLAERKLTDEKLVNRLRPVLLTLKNREERLAFLDDCGFTAAAAGDGAYHAQGRVLNRAALRRPTEPPDAAKAEKIANRTNELVATGMKFEVAFNQALREIK